MTPFFFDDGLFGALHLPHGTTVRQELGVVMLYPAFGEYIQQHRLFYRLAEKLAESGIASLRFDYFGTGDSAGDLAEARLAIWRQNARQAMVKLREETAVSGIALVGSRLGALLATQLAAEEPTATALALWDPVVRGRDFLAQLEALHAKQLSSITDLEDSPTGSRQLLGFTITGELFEEIANAELAAFELLPDQKLLIASTPEVLEDVRAALAPSLTRAWFEEMAFPGGWLQPLDGIYDILVPLPLLRTTVDWIERKAAG